MDFRLRRREIKLLDDSTDLDHILHRGHGPKDLLSSRICIKWGVGRERVAKACRVPVGILDSLMEYVLS